MEWWQFALAFLAGSFVSSFFRGSGSEHRRDLKALERKLDLLLKHHGVVDPWPPAASERVWEQLRLGEKIQAIRVYREEHPEVGLKEAKDMIDALSARPVS